MDKPTLETPEAKPPRKRRKSAAQIAKSEATRKKLLQATAEVIGQFGFAGATIDAITQRAEIAHGAFYLYFSSRQDAFDQVLTDLGKELLAAISANVRHSHDIVELERRGLEANIAFSDTHPYMHRVMTEAELFAPESYRSFMQSLRERYVRSLRRSLQEGQLPGFDEDELEALAVFLMGLRRAFLHAYCLDGWTVREPSSEVYETLSKLIEHGLKAGAAQASEAGKVPNAIEKAPPEN